MLTRLRSRATRGALVGLIAVAGATTMLPADPAAAQNLFDFIFGGLRRVLPPQSPSIGAYAPSRAVPVPLDSQRSERVAPGPSGLRTAFCVRLCDGRYFPIQGRRNISNAEQCNAFCPASRTKVFAGGGIEHAVSGDGRRYADLPNAFVYRERMVPGCTCNGKSPVGLASVPVEDDVTLRPGDVVAGNSGLTVYNGRDPHSEASFTPINSAKVSKSLRNQLANVKVTPRPPSADAKPVITPQNQVSTTGSGDLHRLSARAQ